MPRLAALGGQEPEILISPKLGKTFILAKIQYLWIPLALGAITAILQPAQAGELFLAYPPANHQTTAKQIFLIGSAPAESPVTLNGNLIQLGI